MRMSEFLHLILFLGILGLATPRLHWTRESKERLNKVVGFLREDAVGNFSGPLVLLGYIVCVEDSDQTERLQVNMIKDPDYLHHTTFTTEPSKYVNVSIFLKTKLDYEQISDPNAYPINIECYKGSIDGGPTDVYESKIIVKDVNDVPPTFENIRPEQASYRLEVNEELKGKVPLNLQYEEIIVVDKDGTVRNQNVVAQCIMMSIKGENLPCDGYFDVREFKITFGHYRFDIYALRNSYTEISYILTINAKNIPGTPRYEDEKTITSEDKSVTIIVKDLQNMKPEFSINSLSFTISENHTVNTVIGAPILVRDQDRDPNAINTSMRVFAGDPYGFDNGFFRLEKTSPPEGTSRYYRANIVLVKQIDRERIPGTSNFVYVEVVAQEVVPSGIKDRPTQNATARVSVKVLDINDETPYFDKDVYTLTFTELTGNFLDDELAQSREILSNIKVVDRDEAPYNSFDVTIASGNEQGFFSLNSNETQQRNFAYTLLAKTKILDFDINDVNNYTLTLKAIDKDRPGLESTAIVEIHITDTNDNRPKFINRSYTFYLAENSPNNTNIGTVSATDKDRNDNITYKIIGDTSFRISPDGGIYLNGTVDYEERVSYQISVIVEDSANQTDQATVSIIITDRDDVGPVFAQRAYFATVEEDSTTLIPPIQIKAEAVGSEPVSYGITKVTPEALLSYFSMDSSTGKLTLLRTINYKNTTNGVVNLDFIATAGNLSSKVLGTITVIDSNNFAPEFQPNNTVTFFATVSELVPKGFNVYNMTVIDRDGSDTEYGTVRFMILKGSYDAFVIGDSSGKVVTNRKLDYDDIKLYSLVIRARDNGIPVKSSTATLSIQLINENNKPPVFTEALIRATVRQNSTLGINITQVRATDPDTDGRVEYSLSFVDATYTLNSVSAPLFIDGSKYFSIDKDSGIVRLAGPVNRATLFDRAYFKAVAEDVNVDAGQPRQTATTEIIITVLGAIQTRIYFLTPDGPIIDPTVTIDFQEGAVTSNIPIFQLQAFDPNVSRSIDTFIEKLDVDKDDYFGINKTSVVLRKTLDYEKLDNKQIETVVYGISNDTMRTGTLTLKVNVGDINDNAPKFDQPEYIFEVLESSRFPDPVGSVAATDPDSNSFGKLHFMLTGTGHEHFDISSDPRSIETTYIYGNIIVANNSALDYETNSFYSLQVVALDNQLGEESDRKRTIVPLRINLIDYNDNAPIFRNNVTEISVVRNRNEIDRKSIGQVIADDADTGRNGQVEYLIQSSNNQGGSYFGIRTDARNIGQASEFYIGNVYVKRSLLNLPDDIRFEMTIIAYDNIDRSPQFTGSATLIITVSADGKDPKPKWEQGLPSSVNITEDSPIGLNVARLIAFPSNKSSGIEYSFVEDGNNDYKTFALDTNTGEITLNGSLDYNQQRSYNLLVIATDTGNRTLINQFLLVVYILDVNNHLPTFTSCPGKLRPIPVVTYVLEEQDPEVFVHQAKACDLDPVAYHEMRYTWFSDSTYCPVENHRVFSLDVDDGTIKTRVRLDREDVSQYLLCVQVSEKPQQNTRKKRDLVSDLRARTNHDTVQYVLVNVLDVNDNGPTFFEDFVEQVILEYPPQTGVSFAEAFDPDQAPNNGIRYTIDSIDFTYGGRKRPQPTTFTVSGKDGTVTVGTNDFSDFYGGYFDIVVRASDIFNGDLYDTQTQRVYVAKKENLVRVVFNKEADLGVERDANKMITELNDLNRQFYQIMKISYHIIDNDKDPLYSKTDVCMVVVRRDNVLTATDAANVLNEQQEIDIIRNYGARDPGTCEPAKSVYPDGWESYWWVLVAFAIFIFILVLILIVLTVILHNQYKNYMDTRKTYLVPGN